MPIIYAIFISALLFFNFLCRLSLVEFQGFRCDNLRIQSYVLLSAVQHPYDRSGFHKNRLLMMWRNNFPYCLANSAPDLLYAAGDFSTHSKKARYVSVGFPFVYQGHFLCNCQKFVFSFRIRIIFRSGRTIRIHRWE